MSDLMKQFVFSADISAEKTPHLYEIIAEAGLSPETITIKMVGGQMKIFATEAAQPVVEAALVSPELDLIEFGHKATAKSDALAAAYAKRISDGFVADMPAGGIATFQIRPQDQPNWLTAKALYQDAMAVAQGDVAGAHMRDADDQVHVLTFDQANAVLAAMAVYGATLMRVNWAHKDAIKAASNAAELDAIDIEAEWP